MQPIGCENESCKAEQSTGRYRSAGRVLRLQMDKVVFDRNV